MFNIEVRNVHDALPRVLRELELYGVPAETRNGPVLVFPKPVCVEYARPRERVIFWGERDANPYFHFFESLWMLSGRNDVGFLARFNSNIANYSDNGETFHGAYGHRWRKHFGGSHFDADQVRHVINGLARDPNCRRQIIQIWDATEDLSRTSKDLPCNLIITFQIGGGALNMTVFNRSNDIIWGMLGANAVHFSMLHEYIACSLGIVVGWYCQVSANCHAYKNELLARCTATIKEIPEPPSRSRLWNPYDSQEVRPGILFGSRSGSREDWDQDLEHFMFGVDNSGMSSKFLTEFFTDTVHPMYHSHFLYKTGDLGFAKTKARKIAATDWRKACVEWLERRETTRKAKHGTEVI